MALNFPANPNLNDLHTESGTTWKYDGVGWVVDTQDPTITFTEGNDISITGTYPNWNISSTSWIDHTAFGNIVVATQDTVSAPDIGSNLTLVAGDNIAITTDSVTNSVTFAGAVGYDSFSIEKNTSSGNGDLSYDNAGTYTFTPAETTKELVQIVSSIPTGNPPQFRVNARDFQIYYQTVESTANWTINVYATTNQNFNNYLEINDSVTLVFMATQGATAYLPTDFQIDNVTQTVLWSFGNAPLAGTINALDVYSYTITKTANNTYTVLGNVSFYQ